MTRPLRSRALQRFERSVGEAELAVVVVLDDDGVVTLGPTEQRGPAPQREHCPERELVGRRHVHHAGVARQLGYVEPLVVHGHADDAGTV